MSPPGNAEAFVGWISDDSTKGVIQHRNALTGRPQGAS
jgi:hypothetical protein